MPDNVLTYAYAKDWSDLDPSVAFAAENDILNQIYETLTIYDTDTGAVLPGLATSWESNSTGTVWTFHLRSGVMFQDGTPFTADAVKFSVERTKKISQGASYIYDAVQSIDVVDPLTVRFNLSAPRPMDLISSAAWGAFIMSPTSDNQPDSWFQQGRGVGTGPYMWSSYHPSQSALLTRFPGYWGGWHAGQFTQVLFNITPDAATRAQDVLTGEAALTFNVPIADLPALSQRGSLTLYSLNVLGPQLLQLNTVRPPLNNVKVRQALAYSFPIDDIMKSVYGAYATKDTGSYVPNGVWGHASLPGYSYDLTKARQLLTDAGYPNGGFTEQFIYPPGFPEQKLVGELWQASLAKLDITLTIQGVTNNNFGSLSMGNPSSQRPFVFSYWEPVYASPEDYLFSNFVRTSGADVPDYNNPQFNALVLQGLAQSATDRTAAAATFTQAQQILFNDVPGIPTVDQPEVFVAQSGISGFKGVGFTLYLYDLAKAP